MGDAESSEKKALPFEELDRVYVSFAVSPPRTSPLIALLYTSERVPTCLVAYELATPAVMPLPFSVDLCGIRTNRVAKFRLINSA
jgi:hypothetical protein